MSPHKTNARGTYVLDRTIKGVGRIKRASGTNDPELAKLMDAMLKTLRKAGRLDVLRAIRDGVNTPLEVWNKFRASDLDSLPTPEGMRTLEDAMTAWAKDAEAGAWHKQARASQVRTLLKQARKGDTLAELPAVLRRYQGVARGKTMFNRVRAMCQAFVRDTLGRSHPIYGQLVDVQPKKVRKREPKPFLTPHELAEFAPKMGDLAPCVWAMALTGMGLGEYYGRWTAKADRVVIYGTKRAGRRREVPLAGAIAAPRGTREAFQRKWRKVAEPDRVPYDLRHTFAVWLEAAGIPRTRRNIYRGHGVRDIGDLYERHEVTAYLAEDGEKLRTWLGGKAPKAGLRLA